MRTVVALGGNAIVRKGQRGTVAQQQAAIRSASAGLASLAAAGLQLVVTHGNGPQVGRLLLQQRCAEDVAPAMPLDVLGAQAQGEIGYLLQQELTGALGSKGLRHTVVTLLTQVVVRGDDPAFADPVKPIGPHYTEAELDAAGATTDGAVWIVGEARYREAAGGSWRRVVASPHPVDVIEISAVRRLLDAGCIPVCGGGGGVPVVRDGERLTGVVAVVDKDRTAALLTRLLDAETLLILTDVDGVRLHYGMPSERAVRRLTVGEAEELLAGGEFAVGSMGPKVAAAVDVARRGGRAVIAALPDATAALAGEAGTEIIA